MPGFEVLGKEERKAVNKVFDDGGILFAHGFKAQRKKYYVREFEKDLAKKFKCKFALPVSNGTSAIKIALKSLNVGINDEVITQSFISFKPYRHQKFAYTLHHINAISI